MLQLVCFDLQTPVKSFDALEEGIRRSGGGINFLNGPWISGSHKTSQDLLEEVQTSLTRAAAARNQKFNDKLLVFPASMGRIGTGRRDDLLTMAEMGACLRERAVTAVGLNAEERERLAEAAEAVEEIFKPHKRFKPTRRDERVLAVAYALRNPWGRFHVPESEQRRHREAVKRAIETFQDHCHPLSTVWFVKTRESIQEAHLEIEKNAPLISKDELMVVEVETAVKGACVNLDPADEVWLREHGVLPPAATQRLAS